LLQRLVSRALLKPQRGFPAKAGDFFAAADHRGERLSLVPGGETTNWMTREGGERRADAAKR
jgi:hypothetical protein